MESLGSHLDRYVIHVGPRPVAHENACPQAPLRAFTEECESVPARKQIALCAGYLVIGPRMARAYDAAVGRHSAYIGSGNAYPHGAP